MHVTWLLYNNHLMTIPLNTFYFINAFMMIAYKMGWADACFMRSYNNHCYSILWYGVSGWVYTKTLHRPINTKRCQS